MKKIITIILALVALGQHFILGQKVGINTDSPQEMLEVYGSGAEYVRLQSTSEFTDFGLELIRGSDASNARDWAMINNASGLYFMTETDNFSGPIATTLADKYMRIMNNGNISIGNANPLSKLHITDGANTELGTGGYMLLGPKSSINMAIDRNGFQVRNNGSTSPIFIQNDGGTTQLGGIGSNIYFRGDQVKIGGGPSGGKLNVDHHDYQLSFRNQGDGVGNWNEWYIGASNDTWLSGGDQLLFSPDLLSSSAIFRLKDVNENDGIEAPVMITNTPNQMMLLDGNEIDTKSSLYINHNSQHRTNINLNGGSIGIGTSSPLTKLHVKTNSFGVALQKGDLIWSISPLANGDVSFSNHNGIVALIDNSGGGSWVALSDESKKENIKLLEHASSLIGQIGTYSYSIKGDKSKKKDMGVMAQEIEDILPEAVKQSNGQYGVSYDVLTVVALKGVQEQQERLEKIEEKLKKLNSTN